MGEMRLRRTTQNLLFAVLLVAIGISSYVAGWPIAQRMEEYLAFVSTSRLTHSQLVAASPVFAVWRLSPRPEALSSESGAF